MKQHSRPKTDRFSPSQMDYARKQADSRPESSLEVEKQKWRSAWLNMIQELQSISKSEPADRADIYWIAAGIADKWLQKVDH